MKNLLFILPFLLSLSPTCFTVSQEDKDFQEYLKGFEDIPPSSQIYTKENRNILQQINKDPDRRLVPKFFYGKPVALSPYVYYRGMTKFTCGENIVTLIDVVCDTCAGNWQLLTASLWMVSYTKEGQIIDRIKIVSEEHDTFEGRFQTYSDSAVLLSFHTRLGIIM